jgi:hypothetical protein
MSKIQAKEKIEAIKKRIQRENEGYDDEGCYDSALEFVDVNPHYEIHHQTAEKYAILCRDFNDTGNTFLSKIYKNKALEMFKKASMVSSVDPEVPHLGILDLIKFFKYLKDENWVEPKDEKYLFDLFMDDQFQGGAGHFQSVLEFFMSIDNGLSIFLDGLFQKAIAKFQPTLHFHPEREYFLSMFSSKCETPCNFPELQHRLALIPSFSKEVMIDQDMLFNEMEILFLKSFIHVLCGEYIFQGLDTTHDSETVNDSFLSVFQKLDPAKFQLEIAIWLLLLSTQKGLNLSAQSLFLQLPQEVRNNAQSQITSSSQSLKRKRI